ncbi:MAG: acetylornithine transaminase [Pseudomonadales bacterium]|nr:acetylornithine transaminase [Pseudomonadales bacterium]
MNKPNPYSSVMQIADRPDIVFVSGRGSWLVDDQDQKYLDFIQGWAVNCLGHCPTQITQAVSKQVNTLINASPAFYNNVMLKLADSLVRHSCLHQVFFANSGAEANEGAIKLARKWGQLHKGGANKIITFNNAFHGRTLATMSASAKAQFEPLFEPKVPGFTKVPFNDLSALQQAIDPMTVAIMLEPIQGEAGVIPAQLEFIAGVRQLCDQYDLLLILDEIQTGIGRTGSLFAYQQYAIEPDILTLGKGIAGGLPLAALLAKDKFCCFAHGDQGGTFNGNPLVSAAGQAVLDTVADAEFLAQVQHLSDYLREGLLQLSTSFNLGEVRGSGLLLALETGSLDATDIVRLALQKQLLLNAPRPHTLRFMPALNVSEQEISEMLKTLAAILGSLVTAKS